MGGFAPQTPLKVGLRPPAPPELGIAVPSELGIAVPLELGIAVPLELGIAAKLVCVCVLNNVFFTIRSQNRDLGAKAPRKYSYGRRLVRTLRIFCVLAN